MTRHWWIAAALIAALILCAVVVGCRTQAILATYPWILPVSALLTLVPIGFTLYFLIMAAFRSLPRKTDIEGMQHFRQGLGDAFASLSGRFPFVILLLFAVGFGLQVLGHGADLACPVTDAAIEAAGNTG